MHFPDVPDGITFRVVQRDEYAKAGYEPELALEPRFLKGAADRGDDMIGAFTGARLISYVWRARGWAPHVDGLRVRVSAPNCYAYKSFTVPAYRGKRISPATHLHSDIAMAREGYTHRVGFVAITNYESLAMGKHMNSRIIGYAGYGRWFGRYFPFRTRGARETGFEFFRPSDG
jgi:hypothetical protein